jgi:hypothetical protein
LATWQLIVLFSKMLKFSNNEKKNSLFFKEQNFLTHRWWRTF